MADGNVDDSLNVFMYMCEHYLTRKTASQEGYRNLTFVFSEAHSVIQTQ